VAETSLDAQKRKEATARYDNLNRRIEAIDRDMSSETDGERLATLREKRADLARDREGVAAELAALEKRTNGDLDTFIRNVAKLGPPWQSSPVTFNRLLHLGLVLENLHQPPGIDILVVPAPHCVFDVFAEKRHRKIHR
jgi:hypothetical protein